LQFLIGVVFCYRLIEKINRRFYAIELTCEEIGDEPVRTRSSHAKKGRVAKSEGERK